MTVQEQLAKITAWLQQAYGPRLLSLIAYGSAAGGNHHAKHSDINLLAVMDRLDAAALDLGVAAVAWWVHQGHPPVVMLSRDEQSDDAELFPLEYLDIHHNHRLLTGEDFFQTAPPVTPTHRLQLRHDLRSKLLRLRGAYMAVGQDGKKLEALLLDSVSTFLTLFRHALIAVGEPVKIPKDEVLAAAARRFGFDPAPFEQVLLARRQEKRLEGGKLELLKVLFARYLAGIEQVEGALEGSDATNLARS